MKISTFRNLSIRAKLTSLMVLTSVIVLLLASGVFIVNDVVKIRSAMVRDLTVLANVIGRNSSAALAFNDEEAAKEILSALSAETHIMAAILPDSIETEFKAVSVELLNEITRSVANG
jgi:sensor histidine kinase regulating citrate/malate metabolism